MSQIIEPGATIGVFGSGQLGRMFAIAARRLGYRVHVFSPDDDTPTGQVADVEFQSPYGDLDAVSQFAQQVDVVTFEFENVPVGTVECAAKHAPVHPAGEVLHTTQQRLREKTFLQKIGVPVTPLLPIRSTDDFDHVEDRFLPGILKSAAWGYDGKGQSRVDSRDAVKSAWSGLGCEEAVLEKFVNFAAELSIVAVRSHDGSFVSYGPIANIHRNHILDVSVVPGDFPEKISGEAIAIARGIMESLQVVGVLCVEFFLTADGDLLVNELAPRPHNSGHLTIDAHAACQFEQQVRAVCGLPLATATLLRPAAMVNLLGDIWAEKIPDWSSALAMPDVKLHLYGKREPRPGRKMGHLTALAEAPIEAIERALAARRSLAPQHFEAIASSESADSSVRKPNSRVPLSG